MRLGDTKVGKDKASSLAKRVSERGRHWAGGLQTRGQGKSEGDEEAGTERGRESQEYKKGTSERGDAIYAAGAAGPCEHENLTRRHTRLGGTLFPAGTTASSVLQQEANSYYRGFLRIETLS